MRPWTAWVCFLTLAASPLFAGGEQGKGDQAQKERNQAIEQVRGAVEAQAKELMARAEQTIAGIELKKREVLKQLEQQELQVRKQAEEQRKKLQMEAEAKVRQINEAFEKAAKAQAQKPLTKSQPPAIAEAKHPGATPEETRIETEIQGLRNEVKELRGALDRIQHLLEAISGQHKEQPKPHPKKEGKPVC